VTATFGVEEEFFLSAADTGLLRDDADSILEHADVAVRDGLDHELRSAMVEIGTAVCSDTDMLRRDLQRRRAVLVDAAAARGAVVLATSTHPSAEPHRSGYGDDERYRRMARVFGELADEALVCGCHIHVRVPQPEAGLRAIDRIGGWLPVLLALSANSPFWACRDTRFDSWRARVWCRWPTAGPTSEFGSLAGYEERAEQLIATGAALDRGMLYYDARLSERYPTVEIRIADVCIDIEDAVVIAALTRALVTTAMTMETAPPPLPVEVKRAASFTAARSGLNGQLFDPSSRQPAAATEVISRLIAAVRDALDAERDYELVADGVARILQRGNGATRQRAARRHGDAALHNLLTVA
jgi:carboxylate-amine ligase